MAVDNWGTLYIDDMRVPVLSTRGYNWWDNVSKDVFLEAGSHTVMVEVDNSIDAGSYGGFVMSMVEKANTNVPVVVSDENWELIV